MLRSVIRKEIQCSKENTLQVSIFTKLNNMKHFLIYFLSEDLIKSVFSILLVFLVFSFFINYYFAIFYFFKLWIRWFPVLQDFSSLNSWKDIYFFCLYVLHNRNKKNSKLKQLWKKKNDWVLWSQVIIIIYCSEG